MKRQMQKSLNTKRSVRIGRHKTSVSLEDAFWKDIKEIAANRNVRYRISSPRSTPDVTMAVFHLRSVFSCLSTIALKSSARKSAERPIDEKGRPVRAAHSGPI